MRHWVTVMNESRVGQYMDAVEKRMVSAYIDRNPHFVLDIGGGTGRWSNWLQANSYPHLLLDLDRGALRETRQYYPTLVVSQANAEQIPLASNSLKTIIAVQLFGSVSDRPKFLAECYRVLQDDGDLFISWSNKRSIKGLLFRGWQWYRGIPRPDQLNFYATTHSQNMQMLTDAGFRVVDKIGYSWTMLPRGHNSRLVDIMVAIESGLRLNRLISISPNVMLAAKKQ